MELRAPAGDTRFWESLLKLNAVNIVLSKQGEEVHLDPAWSQRSKTKVQVRG